MSYPNVVIVGTMKSGTTSVFHYLKVHPQVLGSSTKETLYFMDKTSSVFPEKWNYIDQGIEGYQTFFKPDKNKPSPEVILDATPGFMYQQNALKAFATEPELSKTKVIFILREPVSKLRSLYNYFCHTRLEIPRETTFFEFIKMVENKSEHLKSNEFLSNAIDHGQYIDHIEKWIEACGRERIHIFLYEDLKRDNTSFMKKLCGLLKIDPSFFDEFEFKKKNPTLYVKNTRFHQFIGKFKKKIPHSPFRDKIRDLYRSRNFSKENQTVEVSSEEIEIEKTLTDHYAPFNEKLASVLNLDLSSWKPKT